jgi:hypothetical protein
MDFQCDVNDFLMCVFFKCDLTDLTINCSSFGGYYNMYQSSGLGLLGDIFWA